MKKKAVVLLSGGLDSTVNLYEAHQVFDVVQVITIDYGQRALSKELLAAQYFCNQLKLPWVSLDFKWLSSISKSSLTSKAEVPQGAEVDIESYEVSVQSAKSVWVPNRNGLFLNIAGVYADALGADFIIPGFNKEEAETFPDNSKEFMTATTKALAFSTRNQAKVFCFTTDLNKVEIMKRAIELNIPIDKLWPCYHSFDTWCGECESCLRFKRALAGSDFEFKD
jgi:7-cyano-7-deazaguanine synthase